MPSGDRAPSRRPLVSEAPEPGIELLPVHVPGEVCLSSLTASRKRQDERCARRRAPRTIKSAKTADTVSPAVRDVTGVQA